MASFDFATLALRYAQDERNGCSPPFLQPFVLSVAERQRSEVEGRILQVCRYGVRNRNVWPLMKRAASDTR